MTSVYGYIIPPFKVNDFVPIVYCDETDYYIAEIKEHCITDFISIDKTEFEIKEFAKDEKQTVDIGSPALYAFLNDTGHYSLHWPDTLFDFYIKALHSSRYNMYARLSIATVLDLVGLKYKLIENINYGFNIKECGYSYPFIDQEAFERYSFSRKREMQATFEMLEMISKKHHSYISWEDLIYVWRDYIYIGKFKISSRHFKRDFPDAKLILLNYLSTKNLNQQLTIIRSNRLTFLELIPNARELVANTEPHEVLKDYYMERQSTQRLNEYSQKLSEVELEYYTSQFNSILALGDA